MKLLFALTLHLVFASTVCAEDIKLSDRAKDGKLKRIFAASRDGYTLFKAVFNQGAPPNLTFGRLTNAKLVRPSFSTGDPKYNTDPPRRPIQISANLTIIRRNKGVNDVNIPETITWDELVLQGYWSGGHYTAYQGLTEVGFDPFAHDGEVAFRFDASKQGRSQFEDLLIVPDGWGSQIDTAVAWRLSNKALFERTILTKDELATLRNNSGSSNPLIKKMASSLLMRHKALSAEDMKAWLQSEPSLVDVAVTVQLMLAHDPRASVVAMPAWMLTKGERVWGGALTGATLVFAQNQNAVTSMMLYHGKLREAKQVQSDETNALKAAAKSQVGYDTVEAIGAELIKTNAIRNYPLFSAANEILMATYVIDRALLSFDANSIKK